MISTHSIRPTIEKYTNGLLPVSSCNPAWKSLQCDAIRLALKSAQLELIGELYDDMLSDSHHDRLIEEIKLAILQEELRLYAGS